MRTRWGSTPPDMVLDRLNTAISRALANQYPLEDSKQVLASLRVSPSRRKSWRQAGLAHPNTKAGTFVELCAELDGLLARRVTGEIYRRAFAAPGNNDKRYAAAVKDSATMLLTAQKRLETLERKDAEAAEEAARRAQMSGRDQVPIEVLDAMSFEEREALVALEAEAEAVTERARELLEAARKRMLLDSQATTNDT